MLIRTSIDSYARLITSKTRVAPNKNYTIPRLEQLSELILPRLASPVREALEKQLLLESVYLWLDNTTVINWIIGKKRMEAICTEPYRCLRRFTSRRSVPKLMIYDKVH